MHMLATEEMKRDFSRDGAIVVRGLFTPDQLKSVRESFDYGIAHPSPVAGNVFKGTDEEHFNDFTNPANSDHYVGMIKELGLHDLMASLWDSENVWFLGEELFVKTGGKAGRSPWHQDTSYLAANGDHLANIWISFESLPRENSLEIVRRSHRGIQYDGAAYMDPSDPTRPVWGEGSFARLPDIEAERRKDPASWDVVSWAMEPGDALVFHSGALHGGAPVSPKCPTRHTLVLRFFGDRLFYRPLPSTKPDYPLDMRKYEDKSMTPGAAFRARYYPQLR
jgi:ectoine hydroxylase-related dioxygenase (phytanoyl-CoA dioxygenase family)